MRRLIQTSSVCLALALAGCESEPEETPDITQAIPLNVDAEGDPSAATGNDEAANGGAANGTPAPPGTPGEDNDIDTAVGERSLPETMEAGSNPPGFEPPSGSKVQRFN